MKKSLIAGMAILVASNAAAEFEIEGARTASQQVAMELTNSIRVGDVSSGDVRSAHSVGVSYGAFQYWTTGFSVEIENTQGKDSSFDVNGIEWSNNFQIVGSPEGAPASPFAMSLYSAFEIDLTGGQDIDFKVGPVFEYATGATSLAANTFFDVPMQGAGNTAFNYALGTMYSLNESVALGVEAHGEIESVFDGAPSVSDQEHFAGPAVDVAFEVDGQEIGAHFGAFYGLTDATPTLGIAANLEFGF